MTEERKEGEEEGDWRRIHSLLNYVNNNRNHYHIPIKICVAIAITAGHCARPEHAVGRLADGTVCQGRLLLPSRLGAEVMVEMSLRRTAVSSAWLSTVHCK